MVVIVICRPRSSSSVSRQSLSVSHCQSVVVSQLLSVSCCQSVVVSQLSSRQSSVSHPPLSVVVHHPSVVCRMTDDVQTSASSSIVVHIVVSWSLVGHWSSSISRQSLSVFVHIVIGRRLHCRPSSVVVHDVVRRLPRSSSSSSVVHGHHRLLSSVVCCLSSVVICRLWSSVVCGRLSSVVVCRLWSSVVCRRLSSVVVCRLSSVVVRRLSSVVCRGLSSVVVGCGRLWSVVVRCRLLLVIVCCWSSSVVGHRLSSVVCRRPSSTVIVHSCHRPLSSSSIIHGRRHPSFTTNWLPTLEYDYSCAGVSFQ